MENLFDKELGIEDTEKGDSGEGKVYIHIRAFDNRQIHLAFVSEGNDMEFGLLKADAEDLFKNLGDAIKSIN